MEDYRDELFAGLAWWRPGPLNSTNNSPTDLALNSTVFWRARGTSSFLVDLEAWLGRGPTDAALNSTVLWRTTGTSFLLVDLEAWLGGGLANSTKNGPTD